MRGILHCSRATGHMKSLVIAIAIVFICVLLFLNYKYNASVGQFTRRKVNDNEAGEYFGQRRPKVNATSISREEKKNSDWIKWRDPVPVYVVEEHHEVARYWMWAAQAGVLPHRFHNTLIHIDAHSDAAPPPIKPDSPFLRWPNLASISRLVTGNDEFIQAVAHTGLFSRVVWVWPTWARDGIPVEVQSGATCTIWNISLGSWQRPVTANKTFSEQVGKTNAPTSVKDLCFCVTPLNPQKHCDESMRSKHCFRVNSSDASDILPLLSETCHEKLNLTVETYSETDLLKQTKPGGLFQPLAAQEGFILDIDEDFFGCEPVAQSLYDVGLTESYLQTLSFLVGTLFCGDTAEHELLTDFIFQRIINFLMDNRDLCANVKDNLTLSPEKALKNPCAVRAYEDLMTTMRTKLASLNNAPFVDTLFCKSGDIAFHKFALYHLLSLLASLNNEQMKAVAEVGICFPTSLHTFEDALVGHFRLCDGYNRPNNTVVTFFSPKPEDIKERGKRLDIILRQVRAIPELVTLCRSARDGYTPRSSFQQIEKTVLRSLRQRYASLKGDSNSIRIMYDRDLLGGKRGWWQRHKMDE